MKKHVILLTFWKVFGPGFILGWALILTAPLHAQSYSTDVRNFLDAVYQHHPTLISERLSYRQSQLGITEAEGLYDPLWTGRITRQKDAATYFAQTGQFVSKESTTVQTSISQKLDSGADLSLGIQSTQQDNNGTLYSSRLAMDITQPLLNGMGTLPTEISILTAKYTAAQDQYAYRSTVANTLRDALSTYASYVAAQQKEQFYNEEQLLAHYLVAQINKKSSLELADTVALLDAKIQVLRAEDAKHTAEHEREGLAIALQRLSGKQWEPTRSTQISLPNPLPLQDAIAGTLAHNPDLLAAKIAIESQKATVQLYENQALPMLDLNGSLGYNKTGSAWQDSLDFQDPSFAIGLSTSLPWGNREANAKLAQARLALQDMETQYAQQQADIIQEIQTAYRDADLKQERMGYHHSMQGLADQKLAIEKKKFELGLSLVDTLLEAQKDKTDAAIQAASAELDYIQACLRRDALLGRMSEWVNL